MRRIIMLLTVALFMAAMMLVIAVPVLAESKSGTAPNCERGQLTATFNSAQGEKHLEKFFSCVSG